MFSNREQISSEFSTIIQPIASVFHMPQISYASVSPRLTDSRFPFFFRTTPNDDQFQTAIAFLVAHFGWYRVAYFSSSDSYGLDGLAALTDVGSNLGIQLVQTQSVSSTGTDEFFMEGEVQDDARSEEFFPSSLSLQPHILR